MQPAPRPRPPAPGGVELRPGELAALLLQSILLAISVGFMAALLFGRYLPLSRPIAFGLGLEVGLLISFPTIRIVARSDGTDLRFSTWIGITLIPSALGIVLLTVL